MIIETVLNCVIVLLSFLLIGCGGFVAAEKTKAYASEGWISLSLIGWSTSFLMFVIMFAGWMIFFIDSFPPLQKNLIPTGLAILSVIAAYLATDIISDRSIPRNKS